jgi:hypothetical protein
VSTSFPTGSSSPALTVHGGEVSIGDSDSGGGRLEIRWPSGDRR